MPCAVVEHLFERMFVSGDRVRGEIAGLDKQIQQKIVQRSTLVGAV